MFVAVATGTPTGNVNPGDQYLITSNLARYVLQLPSDSTALQSVLGDLVPMSCAWINNLKEL